MVSRSWELPSVGHRSIHSSHRTIRLCHMLGRTLPRRVIRRADRSRDIDLRMPSGSPKGPLWVTLSKVHVLAEARVLRWAKRKVLVSASRRAQVMERVLALRTVPVWAERRAQVMERV